MARTSWLEKLETGVVVTVVSVLVWLYAEGENVTNEQQVMQVRFVPPPGQELAIDPREAEVVVGLRAAAGDLGWLQQHLRSQSPVEIVVTNSSDPDAIQQTVVLKDALERSAIGDLGVNIVGTDPVTRTIRVEPLVTRTVPVVPAAVDVQFAEQPTFTPAQVEITVPRSLADEAASAAAVARLDDLNMAAFEENTDVTATVRLDLPRPLRTPWSRVARQNVQATFNIRKLTDSLRLANIPLRVNVDPITLQEYEIALSPSDIVVRDVRLTGPSDVIDSVETGEARVWAEIRPTRDQIERGETSFTPIIVAPPGVTFDMPAPVPVTIRRK